MKLNIFILSACIFCLAFLPVKRKFIDPANMDLSVKPGDNFFLYANGAWLRNNPMPPSKTRWGSFDELREESSRRLQTILEEAAAAPASEKQTQKIGNFYLSGMDSSTAEKKGFQPLRSDLERINNISDIAGVVNEMAYQRTIGAGTPLFGFGVPQDAKNVNRYILQFYQGGLTLPDRDYYLKNDNRSESVRSAYITHLGNMFQLIGENAEAGKAKAAGIMRIETALAKNQLSRVELRDPQRTYNKFSVSGLDQLAPAFGWNNMIKTLGVTSTVDSVLVNNPEFFRSADKLLSTIPLADWKSYLSWNIVSTAAPYLSSDFVKEAFSLTKLLTGQKEETPRWQRISALIDRQMGDELGKLYAARYFKPAAKQRMQQLVNNLQQTFEKRIQRLDWMGEETKKGALEKLHAFSKKIGYPDKWKDYSSVIINKDDLIGNIRRSAIWNYNDMIERVGKPVDKSRWSMTPPTVNAYYNSLNNEIVFPAAILQFPFFDFEADDAVNYGGIGAVIGHEMTHGFDDRGRQFAPEGTLRDWWTAEDAARFKALADKVVTQYDALVVNDSIHVNGRLTLGENLADFGGLAMAYEAFTHTKQFKEGKKIDGFTPAQRFFLSWAQVWRANTLPETAAQLILTDTHSPAIHRANNPLTNMNAWYEAFNVKQGDKLYRAPEERVKVW